MRERDITISILEERLIKYFVRDLKIKEEISEVTDIKAEVLIFHRDVLRLRIDLHTEVRIKIRSYPIIDGVEGVFERFFHGYVVSSSKNCYKGDGFPVRLSTYVLELNIKHKLYDLALNNNYFIHKDKTAGIALRELCDKYLIYMHSHATSLDGVEKMLIQYGENDLHFFERLLQYFGCYYICREDLGEVKVFDSIMGYEDVDREVKFHRISKRDSYEMGTISAVNEHRKLKPRRYTNHDYDRHLPMKLEGVHMEMSRDEYGLIDTYPTSANTVLEIERSAHHFSKQFVDLIYNGISYCFDFKIGKRIIIEEIDMLPKVLTAVTHHFTLDSPEGENHTSKYNYYNNFTLMDATHSFVSNKILKKPLITGVQTGKVASLDKVSEIDVNEKGEIFIDFPWGRDLESRSCWIPVAQSMAGRLFGSFIIPRVGDEVLVHFINGDPDRPIVYGALHTDKTPGFNELPEDKYRTVLMKSHTFTATEPENCNEISMRDIRCKENLFLKAHKDLEMVIGSADRDIENHYTTRIRGRGRKYSHIEDGDYILELESGRFYEKIRGSYETRVCRGEKGGDYFITVEEGILDIKVKGDCRIKVDGALDIGAIGKIIMHSDEEIIINAPIITLDAEDKVSVRAANDVTCEGGRQVKIAAGADIVEEAAGKISLKAAVDIMAEAAGKISLKAAADITEEAAGAIRQKAAGVISSESDMVKIKALTECRMESAVKVTIESGVDIAIKAGVEMKSESGVRMTQKSGVDFATEAGVNVRIESGVHLVARAGVDAAFKGDVMGNFGAAINAKFSSDLILEKIVGLSMEQEVGLEAEMTVGLISDTFVGLFATIRTIIEVFVRRPALF